MKKRNIVVVAVDLWRVRSFHVLLVVLFTIHVGIPLHVLQRHIFCLSTPHNDSAKLFGATSRGGNISKKGPRKGVLSFVAFGGGHLRGAGGPDASDVYTITKELLTVYWLLLR
jgi:hypothetical protein